jgi:2-dehydro-3-deoxyphosphogalactonate aldolase
VGVVSQRLRAALGETPLIAILRGITPSQVLQVTRALVEAGIRVVEVPLNSPEPLRSIELVARWVDGEAMVGGGTVLQPADVGRIGDAGGRLIVTPHCAPPILEAARERGLMTLPGIATPSEAFGALHHGADGLKLFPAEGASPPVLAAMRAVLPPETLVLPVGSITAAAMPAFWEAGADGFGLGSALYRAGQSAEETSRRARSLVEQIRALMARRALAREVRA